MPASMGRSKVFGMIEAGAEPDFQLPPGNIALTIAAEQGHVATLRVILEAGASVDMETLSGVTPLIRAAMCGAEQCVAALIKAGAHPQRETKNGETALMMAVEAEDATAIMTLIKYKGDPDHVTSRGLSPLIRAAILNKPRSATVLRLAGALIELETRACGTALECAAERGHLEVIKSLLMEPQTRAKIDHETLEGNTALCKAARRNQVEAGKLLIDYGAEVNYITKFGNTALIVAVEAGHAEMCRMLLENHASADKPTRIGSARDIALQTGNRNIIEILVKVKGPAASTHPTQVAINKAAKRAELVRDMAGIDQS